MSVLNKLYAWIDRRWPPKYGWVVTQHFDGGALCFMAGYTRARHAVRCFHTMKAKSPNARVELKYARLRHSFKMEFKT